MVEDQTSAIATLATKAAAIHDDLVAASNEVQLAEIAAVGAILQACKPAWAALATRPLIADRYTVGSRNINDNEIRADWRGVLLSCDNAGPSRHPHPSDADSGEYGGQDLFWLGKDVFALLTYSGPWTRWHGGECRWEATATVYDLATLAEDGWLGDGTTDMEAERLAARLGKRLQSVIDGKASARAQAHRRRAERLLAIATLAEGKR